MKRTSIEGLDALQKRHPKMRAPVIDGLLRRAEVMNIIAPAKASISWMLLNLGINSASGKPWLGYKTAPGNVLYINTELHAHDLAARFAAFKIGKKSAVRDRLYFSNLRDTQTNTKCLKKALQSASTMVNLNLKILDSVYQFFNSDSNVATQRFYRMIDDAAGRLNCAIVLRHHVAKPTEKRKMTDVRAGAASQARDCDAHLVLREHEDRRTLVADIGTRSFPPCPPKLLKFSWPTWRAVKGRVK